MVVPKGRGEFQIRPQYILYNEKLNPRGSDDKRDLEIRFQLAQAGGGENKMGSSGSFVLRNLPVGRYMGGAGIHGPEDRFFGPTKYGQHLY